MNWNKGTPLLFFSLLLLFGACLDLKQPRNKIEYYTLEYETPKIAGLKPLPIMIRMERFSVAPSYNSNQIIYRDRSFKRDAYSYHRWRANPGDLVAHNLSRDIRRSGLFKAVLPHDSRSVSSHVMEGMVDEFFEWDTEEAWKAILSVSITLMKENEPDVSKRIIFQKGYRAIEVCEQKNPMSLAGAMSRAMSVISMEIIKDIYDHLKEDNLKILEGSS